MKKNPLKMVRAAALATVLAAVAAPSAFGELIAYEGFDYPAGAYVALSNNLNGGIGWATPWYDGPDTNDFSPTLANPAQSVIEAGSLSYTDAVGNVLVTTGNKMRNTGTNGPAPLGASSRPWRLMSSKQGTAGTTNWVSMLGVRLVSPGPETNVARGANFQLYNFRDYCAQNTSTTNQYDWWTNGVNATPLAKDQNGRLGWGKSSGNADPTNNVWCLISSGSASNVRRANYTNNPFTSLALIVVRIEHYNDGVPSLLYTNEDNDTAYAWINPTNLSVQPADSEAFGFIDHTNPVVPGASPYFNDYAFDCISSFAGVGNSSGANPAAEWYIDEFRAGTTYADVVPYIAPAPPVFNILSITRPTADQVVVTTESTPGRTYVLESRDIVNSGAWTTNDTQTATGPTTSLTHSGVGAISTRFYRVGRTP